MIDAVEILKDLHQRLVLTYNDGEPFEQLEEDRLVVLNTLEKQIPKKPIWDMGWVCPNCRNYEIQHFVKRPDWDDLFCSKCGQALDWSDAE